MFKILKQNEYDEIVNKINELVKENETMNKTIKTLWDENHPKYFNQ